MFISYSIVHCCRWRYIYIYIHKPLVKKNWLLHICYNILYVTVHIVRELNQTSELIFLFSFSWITLYNICILNVFVCLSKLDRYMYVCSITTREYIINKSFPIFSTFSSDLPLSRSWEMEYSFYQRSVENQNTPFYL